MIVLGAGDRSLGGGARLALVFLAAFVALVSGFETPAISAEVCLPAGAYHVLMGAPVVAVDAIVLLGPAGPVEVRFTLRRVPGGLVDLGTIDGVPAYYDADPSGDTPPLLNARWRARDGTLWADRGPRVCEWYPLGSSGLVSFLWPTVPPDAGGGWDTP